MNIIAAVLLNDMVLCVTARILLCCFLHEMANHSVARYLLYRLLAKVFIGLHTTRQLFGNQSKRVATPAFITSVTNKPMLQQKTHCS